MKAARCHAGIGKTMGKSWLEKGVEREVVVVVVVVHVGESKAEHCHVDRTLPSWVDDSGTAKHDCQRGMRLCNREQPDPQNAAARSSKASLMDIPDPSSLNSHCTAEVIQHSSDAEKDSPRVEHSWMDRLDCEACFHHCAGCKEAECRQDAGGHSAAEVDHFLDPGCRGPVHLLAADLRVGRGIAAPSRSFPLGDPWVDFQADLVDLLPRRCSSEVLLLSDLHCRIASVLSLVDFRSKGLRRLGSESCHQEARDDTA